MKKIYIHTIIFFICWFLLNSYQKNWSRDQIQSDVEGYYGYLTAYFNCGDLSLKFLSDPQSSCPRRYWATQTESGSWVMKMSMGMSILYLPFFLLANFVVAPLTGFPSNGYSPAYQISLVVGALFYLLVGFFCLRKVLLLYVKDRIVWWVLWTLFLGTNLLWYAYGEALFSHQFSFSLLCVLLWLTVTFHQQPTYKKAILMGVVIGLIILVRPINIILALLPVVWNLYDVQTLKEKFFLLKTHFYKIIILILITAIVLSPQLCYWRYVSGSWIFYSYVGEHFFFDKPHIIEGLFGFRKGWFIYTPLMIFAVLGIILVFKKVKELTLFFVLVLPLFVYVILCWWCWWYGGSFGMRPFVETYPVLAIPLALVFSWCFNSNPKIKHIFLSGVVFCIALNMFQTWQFNVGILHWDANTKESYMAIFGKVKSSYDYKAKLRPTDPARAIKGLPDEFIRQELFSDTIFYLRASNTFFVSNEGDGLTADKFSADNSSVFRFKPLSGDTIQLRNAENIPVAGADHKYIMNFLEDNAITLKRINDTSYMSLDVDQRKMIFSKVSQVGTKEVLRVYCVK